MGHDKPSLRVGGRTLLERTLDVLGEIFGELLVATDRADRFGRLAGTRVVTDRVADIGPLGGIYTGLEATSKESAFVVACDLPLLDRGVIRRQLDAWRRMRVDALVPVVDGRHQPVHAIYAKSCLPAIRRQVARGNYCVMGVLDAVRVHFWQLGTADAAAFRSVNTPEEWADVVAALGDAKW